MAITLGSFDNLKQELTTVDFRAVGTYRDVGDLSPPILSNILSPYTMEDRVVDTIAIKSRQEPDWLDSRLSSLF